MNFLIKSEQHRATSRYYYLSHRSIQRIAVVHDDLQITPKQLCAGTSPADIHLYRGSLWQKKIPRDGEDTRTFRSRNVHVFNWYRKGENNEIKHRIYSHYASPAKCGCQFFTLTLNIHFSR